MKRFEKLIVRKWNENEYLEKETNELIVIFLPRTKIVRSYRRAVFYYCTVVIIEEDEEIHENL